jgi:hypothetical protein
MMEEGDLFAKPMQKIEQRLSQHVHSRTLYLPTYRRIEKDFREISPEI